MRAALLSERWVIAIVRAPSKEYHHIARACDMGAEGVMLPMVASAREARQILDCMKYHPQGKRGVALGVASKIEVFVEGVPGENDLENNKGTFLAIFEK